jgi:hypothetical protein
MCILRRGLCARACKRVPYSKYVSDRKIVKKKKKTSDVPPKRTRCSDIQMRAAPRPDGNVVIISVEKTVHDADDQTILCTVAERARKWLEFDFM